MRCQRTTGSPVPVSDHRSLVSKLEKKAEAKRQFSPNTVPAIGGKIEESRRRHGIRRKKKRGNVRVSASFFSARRTWAVGPGNVTAQIPIPRLSSAVRNLSGHERRTAGVAVKLATAGEG